MSDSAPHRTSLYANHVKLGARMVPFAGFDMPVQYPAGIIAEHNWTRQSAGLFDVSHMGQCLLEGADFETVAKAMETLVPADVLSLKPHQQRYSQFLNEEGGTLDDLMITRHVKDGTLYVQSGGGVVADSDPEAEYQETVNKAKALVRAAEEAVRFGRG